MEFILMNQDGKYINNCYYRGKCLTTKLSEAYRFEMFELKLAINKIFKNKNVKIVQLNSDGTIPRIYLELEIELIKEIVGCNV